MPTSVVITGAVQGIATGSKSIGPITLSNTNLVGQITDVNLATGVNTITIPANAVMAIIDLPANNVQTVTLKGVTGDTGIPLNVSGTSLLNFPAGTASFVLTAGGTVTGVEISFA